MESRTGFSRAANVSYKDRQREQRITKVDGIHSRYDKSHVSSHAISIVQISKPKLVQYLGLNCSADKMTADKDHVC